MSVDAVAAEHPVSEEISLTESNTIVNEILHDILKKDISDSNFLKNEVDPVAIIALAERIDMEKLVAAHSAVQVQRRLNVRKNELLKRSLLKHFRMKKVFRAYNPDNPELVAELFEKYHTGLDQLDLIIASLERLQEDSSQKLLDIHEQREQLIVAKTENLSLLVKEIQDTTTKLQSSQTGHYLPHEELKKILDRMDGVRSRISEVRLMFIKMVDKHTEIDNLARSLEDLGDGLRMIDFEQLRAERQSLSDKIEERNNELARLRLRCNGDTQILAHVREKEFMLDNYIAKDSERLDTLQEEMSACRNAVNERKTQRDRIRRSFARLSQSCGLLDKPALLLNYDKLVAQIEGKELAIERLQRSTAAAIARTRLDMTVLSQSELPRTRSQQKLAAADDGKAAKLPWVREGVPYKRPAVEALGALVAKGLPA